MTFPRLLIHGIMFILLVGGNASAQETTVPADDRSTDTVLNIAMEAATRPGPFQVGMIKESDGLRNGPEYRGATVYYPKESTNKLASLVLVPGFMAWESTLRTWGPYLASHGIVVMTLGTNKPQDVPLLRAKALLDGIETLKAENKRPDSPLFERMDVDRFAVGGWSMGGGGAQLAAMKDQEIDAVIALCPWKPAPRFNHKVPVLFIAGERDGTASTREHSIPHYESMPEQTDKLLYEIKSGGHWAGNNPRNAQGEVGRVALAWLKVFLIGDESYRPMIMAEPKSATMYRTNVELIEAGPKDDSNGTAGPTDG